MGKLKGDFTLPGEAQYEELTIDLAKKWGADVIRDSDGTKLSDKLLNGDYGIYSTICIIREHNEWLEENMDSLQQTFLMSFPKTAGDSHLGCKLIIDLLQGYFAEQFLVNDSLESLKYWQVFDRTEEKEVNREDWYYCPDSGCVEIKSAKPFHEYTVNFLAYRIWEEINMYNHTTNQWESEHLMPVDPRSLKARTYLLAWLEKWCEINPQTTVVRFTSLFYNFVWIWGSEKQNRHLYTDWGSYDFTVSPKALEDFAKEYGYFLCSEDFVNQGDFHVTHMNPTNKQLDYMRFTNRFVIAYGKQLVDLVHSYDKQAYLFYDDSWVGTEPYFTQFEEFGFDGIIKCVFSGFEVRLCAGVKVPVHEIRLHPYLFPVGLGDKPTFSEGGTPTKDARDFWMALRRALLRCQIDRMGLGGYLHLVKEYPDFVDYIEKIADEFRMIKGLHLEGKPYVVPIKAAVLTSWGKVRSWTLSGHFSETYMHDLIHINEALSGLPMDVEFIDFDDVKHNNLSSYQVIINAGFAGSAWSGGDCWNDCQVVENIRRWVDDGGTLIGVYQPSMTAGGHTNFKVADIYGVDFDVGARCCHGKYSYKVDEALKRKIFSGIPENNLYIKPESSLYLTDLKTSVIAEEWELNSIGEKISIPTITIHSYGKGQGIYLSHFSYSLESTGLLMNLMLYGAGLKAEQEYLCSNILCECAYFPQSHTLVVINQSDTPQSTLVSLPNGKREVTLLANETLFLNKLPFSNNL